MRTAPLCLGVLLLCACSGSPAPSDGSAPLTFTEAVEKVYKHCDAETLRFRAVSKGLQLAFEPCGSNNFVRFAWSPNGLNLYYQASQGGWVRKDTGENYKLRIGVPSARPVWLNGEMLVYPDSTRSKLGIYKVSSHVLHLSEIEQVEPEQLARGEAADEVLYLAAETPGGVKDIYRFHADTGDTEKAFLWLDVGVEEF